MTDYTAAADLLDQLPELLRTTRHQRHLTQRQVGDALFVSKVNVCQIELRRRRIDTTTAARILRWIDHQDQP